MRQNKYPVRLGSNRPKMIFSGVFLLGTRVFHLRKETRFLDMARVKYVPLREFLHGLEQFLGKKPGF